eukprot:1820807-Ditylum_brightwellii.AAC.2
MIQNWMVTNWTFMTTTQISSNKKPMALSIATHNIFIGDKPNPSVIMLPNKQGIVPFFLGQQEQNVAGKELPHI